MLAGELEAGHVITLSTDNARSLLLPHPLLFQIHTIISRGIAMKAAAGFPLFARFDRAGYGDDCLYRRHGWLHHHPEHEHAIPDILSERYEMSAAEPHIMRWFNETSSESNSDTDVHRHITRDRAHDSGTDTDGERPTKYTVVLSEVG